MSHSFSDFIELLHAIPAARQAPNGVVRATALASGTVVVGDGIREVLTAWFLSWRGVSVAPYVKAEIGCELSRRAFEHFFSWSQALAQVSADLVTVRAPAISRHHFALEWCSDGKAVAVVR